MKEQKLKLLVFRSALELGQKVNEQLKQKYNCKEETFLLPIKENFFNDGHLKVEIGETVRGQDVYLLTDIGNYSLEYKMHGFINHTSPNDLVQQLKDGIGACNSHAKYLNVIMPLLYAGRQHRKNTRENLACGQLLYELSNNRHIRSIITFDAHDEGVEHAVHDIEFENFYATNTILENLIHNLPTEQLKRLVFIAPDNGAAGRRNVYLNSFNSEYIDRIAGSFVKQRDYNHMVDGKNPIISHDYSGNSDLKGRTAIIVDDMVASGGSMFDVIHELKKREVTHIYIITTFTLFTEGIQKFQESYARKEFDGIYTTNLSYIPKEYQSEKWLHICDCSSLVADVIYHIHEEQSISSILSDKSYPLKLLKNKFEGKM